MNSSETSLGRMLSQTAALERELGGWEGEVKRLQERIATRRQLLHALRQEAELGTTRLFEPEPTPAGAQAAPASNGNGHRPNATEAIMLILDEHHGPMSAEQVLEQLNRRGWAPLVGNPKNRVNSTLWTLAQRGAIEKTGTRAARLWAMPKTSQPIPNAQGEDGT